MLPRTPQKKNSLALDSKVEPMMNHSQVSVQNYTLNQQSAVFYSPGHPNKILMSPELNNSSVKNNNNKMWLVKQYVHQQMQNKQFKNTKKEKDYRDVVISQQFIKSHKLYKMLKQQILVSQAKNLKQTQQLEEQAAKLATQAKNTKEANHNKKVELWEYRTQLMELKAMLFEQQDQNKKLSEQYEEAYQEGQQGENFEQEPQQKGQQDCQQQNNDQNIQNTEQNGQSRCQLRKLFVPQQFNEQMLQLNQNIKSCQEEHNKNQKSIQKFMFLTNKEKKRCLNQQFLIINEQI